MMPQHCMGLMVPPPCGTDSAPNLQGTDGAPTLQGTDGAPTLQGTDGAPTLQGTDQEKVLKLSHILIRFSTVIYFYYQQIAGPFEFYMHIWNIKGWLWGWCSDCGEHPFFSSNPFLGWLPRTSFRVGARPPSEPTQFVKGNNFNTVVNNLICV